MAIPDAPKEYQVRTSFGGHPWKYSEPMSYEKAKAWLAAPTGDRLTVRIRREIVPVKEAETHA